MIEFKVKFDLQERPYEASFMSVDEVLKTVSVPDDALVIHMRSTGDQGGNNDDNGRVDE